LGERGKVLCRNVFEIHARCLLTKKKKEVSFKKRGGEKKGDRSGKQRLHSDINGYEPLKGQEGALGKSWYKVKTFAEGPKRRGGEFEILLLNKKKKLLGIG